MMTGNRTTQNRLLRAAERLLEKGGADAVTTRAVCAAAHVQAPTLYHHFRDKTGLLDALVVKGLAAFLAGKHAVAETNDALDDLRTSWIGFIAFALDRPQLFHLLVQRVSRNPNIMAEVMATTDGLLARLDAEHRLRQNVALTRIALLALANGVTSLSPQGVPREEIEAVGRLLLDSILGALFKRDRKLTKPGSRANRSTG